MPTERLSRRMQALSQAAVSIQEATTPEEVLNEVGRQLQAIGLAWHESLLSESGSELIIGRHSLPAPVTGTVERLLGIRITGFRVSVERVAVLRQVMRDRQAAYATGVTVIRDTLPWVPAGVVDRLVRLIGAQRMIVAPLLTRGQMHGALTVWSNDLLPDDLPAVVIFAQQVATAYDNARLLVEAQRERSRLEAILEQMPGGVVIADAPGGRVVRANAQVDRLLGHPSFAALGVSDYQRLHGFHRDGRPYAAEEWPLARAIRIGEVVRGEEVAYRLAEGTERILSMNAAPIRDADGSILAGVVTFYDVTDQRRQAERQRLAADASAALNVSLDQAETLKRLAALVVPHLADWCIIDLLAERGACCRHIVTPAHGDDTLRPRPISAVQISPAALPRGLIRALETGNAELVPEVAEDQRAQLLRDEALDGLPDVPVTSFLRLPLRARGRTFGAMLLLTTGDERRYHPGDLALMREVAERAALAFDNARLYRDAQEAIRARDEFLSVAAHELKTPLTSLIGFAQLAGRQFDRTAEGERLDARRLQQALKAIHRQSTTMARLVSQLLDLSRIEAGRLRLSLAPADVTALVELAAEAARVRRTGHAIVVSTPGPLLGQVDALRVEQVLTNLLDNAAKYSPAGSQIDVTVSPLANNAVEIRVRDRGTGIAPEHRERVFDRFFQAHQANHLSGMGIGLYVSRQIVDLHGGELSMESPADGGTAFLVRLPLGHAHVERD